MCGIIGLVDLNSKTDVFNRFKEAVNELSHRGPDHQAHVISAPVALGHTRLSIIDLDARSHQPMTDETGRYTIVFNGEIYNYKHLRQALTQKGYSFKTESDTEVLLKSFIAYGKECLSMLNGFFAFGILDRKEQKLLIARDRMGIKPLVYRLTENEFAFGSELKAVMRLGYVKLIDKVSLFTYFKFNYIPAPSTILRDHYKLEPGCLLEVSWNEEELNHHHERWYEIPYRAENERIPSAKNYQEAQNELIKTLNAAVKMRLVADVKVGTFLSGGMDSSIITALAAREHSNIEAFSIGFPDRPFHDESEFATMVAKHLGVKHHLLPIKDNDLLQASDALMHHLDEPFADASALNMYLLSKYAKSHISVALSGDGGDELFAGYHKHDAEYRIRFPKLIDQAAGNLGVIWNQFPASRSGNLGNLARQLQKFSAGYAMNERDRYWRWAGILSEEEVNFLIKENLLEKTQRLSDDAHIYKKRKDKLLRNIKKGGSLNDVLLTDTLMVLPNDMLFKVDFTSMMHGLEVRTPMLDHNVVQQAFSMPVMYKLNQNKKKKILQDSFKGMLPDVVFTRPKKGFEVPLLEWFQGPMKADFMALCEDKTFIVEQGLFNPEALIELKERIYSKNPGDSPSTAWAFTVFQNWYKTYM